MELRALFAFSRSSGSGSNLSMTMGAGGRTWVARLLVFAGMASLNNSCGGKKQSVLNVLYAASVVHSYEFLIDIVNIKIPSFSKNYTVKKRNPI